MLDIPQQNLRTLARQFALSELMPGAAQRDREALFPKDAFAAMAHLGLMGMLVPSEFGGIGVDHVSYVLAITEIAAADGAASTALQVHNGLTCLAVLKYGSAQQKQRFLRPLAEGKWLGAFCLTEPEAGSDASAITMRARREGDKFVLNGVKHFITSGSNADVVVAFAVTNPQRRKTEYRPLSSRPGRPVIWSLPSSTPWGSDRAIIAKSRSTIAKYPQINCWVMRDRVWKSRSPALNSVASGLPLNRSEWQEPRLTWLLPTPSGVGPLGALL
jgi:hypothetical protein